MAEYIVEADCEYSDEIHQVIERIVRCKDCAYYRTNDGCADVCVIVFDDEFNVEPNGFCAWGERR